MTAHLTVFVDDKSGGRTEPLRYVVVQEFLDDIFDFFSTLAGVRIGGPDVLKLRAKELCRLRDISGNRLFSRHDFGNNYSPIGPCS